MLCAPERCTGCMACISACPLNAIDKVDDIEGFQRPKIIEAICSKCGKCSKVCPEITSSDKKILKQEVYACWSKNSQIRKDSSSGGFFTVVSKIVLDSKGIVFGSTIGEDKKVMHIFIDKEQDLFKLRGSKYVQSDTLHIYEKVLGFLNSGKEVLFSGTPCQIAGLYNYLGRVYDNLITVDIVCHGVPSPKVYYDYINYMEKRYNSKIRNIKFRDKDKSWMYFNMKIQFENNKIYKGRYFLDPYIIGFLNDNFIRPSCYDCRYANTQRVSDITIADFWGYKDTNKNDRNNDKGISLVILNTSKGKEYFNACKVNLIYFERSMEEAVKGNRCLSQSFPKPKKREEFWSDYKKYDFEQIITKYMTYNKVSLVERIMCSFKYNHAKIILIPIRILSKVKRVILYVLQK